ncbi:acyl-ACP thioesterase domain-containing protein [Tissierella sp.]|uniref:acyl-[acyl-carrier-protein] thioesterase n=1 Tax=Tissierella sp. TaxID=41274 RepID=UPI002854B54F|nr:acyl-ACP thioesterase domain-containing protein [Tissierella sp.]MDR7857239.1 thioesterase [Tissierella sp.]
MSKFRKSFEITFYESDKNKKATPLSILTYLGETSGAHTDNMGFDIDNLQSRNYGWMLNRWKVRIDRYPEVKEKIIIETWTSGIDKFFATREFIIYDNNDIEIGRASSLWIFIDISKKRPIRIPTEFYEAANPIEERAFNNFTDFKIDMNITDYIDFHVRRSDIDYNNHVNNTKYLAWMIESIPDFVFENYRLHEFEILYKKEAIYGNTILSGCKELDDLIDKPHFMHSIMDRDINENHAMGMTKWII